MEVMANGPEVSDVSIEELCEIATAGDIPADAIEAVKVALVHDVCVGLSARELISDMVELPEVRPGSGNCTDLIAGGRVDAASAVSRNGQLIHALTQDDTLLPAMTHVGATSIPVLMALAELEEVDIGGLLEGLAAAYAAAESLGRPVAAALSARGVRPTPIVGPAAAVVGAGRMLGWDANRVHRAVSKVAAVAFGTTQAWTEGSQEWLFQVSASGCLALAASRSARGAWLAAADPFWGTAGLFRTLGLTADGATSAQESDPRLAAVRTSLKRFPVCACNQVSLVLLQEAIGRSRGRRVTSVRAYLAPPEAKYPGVSETHNLHSWSARLMSLPYALAVMARTSTFTAASLRGQPDVVSGDDIRAMIVDADASKRIGEYGLEVHLEDETILNEGGTIQSIGVPNRRELDYAATEAVGGETVKQLLARVDDSSSTVRDFASYLAEIPSVP